MFGTPNKTPQVPPALPIRTLKGVTVPTLMNITGAPSNDGCPMPMGLQLLAPPLWTLDHSSDQTGFGMFPSQDDR